MNARLLNFFLCSLCMHVAASWLLLQAGNFEQGVANGMAHMDRVLSVRIIAAEVPRQSTTAQAPAGMTDAPIPDAVVDKEPMPAPSSSTETIEPAPLPQTASDQDYAAAGQLTRLPEPLSEIDLNVPEISEAGFLGEAKLTVLINADGSVVDVISQEDLPGLDEFTGRVAARFRSARFVPGEIKGKPVKSQLQITVVSENTDTHGVH